MKLLLKPSLNRKVECVTTLGVFDGLHRGHQRLLSRMTGISEKRGLSSLVVTFWPHPEQVLGRSFPGFITGLDRRKKLLKDTGIDYLFILRTDGKLLSLNGFDFLNRINQLACTRVLVVGDDFRFGVNAGNTIADLKRFSRDFGFEVKVVSKKKISGTVVSSSLIRKLIREADFGKAEKYLGRPYVLEAGTESGTGVGTEMGFPTLNLDCSQMILPGQGVYGVNIIINGKQYPGVCNIGTKPTVSEKKKINVEAHVINESLGKTPGTVGLMFLKKIRNEKKFPSRDKLRLQIQKDIDKFISISGAFSSLTYQQ